VLNFLFFSQKCTHSKVSVKDGQAFCPDCGQYIKISWQILRCDCCSTKRKPRIHKDHIHPEEKFCKKCGSSEFFLEEKSNPEFFDYDYAILSKEEVKLGEKLKETLQIWIEEENYKEIFDKPKLLPAF
jgi:hypothetical protein